MISKDGEEVDFKTPVPVADNGVKDWLKALETEMRTTLAVLLREAVGATGDLSTTTDGADVSSNPILEPARDCGALVSDRFQDI